MGERPVKTPDGDRLHEAALLASAKSGDRHAFQQLSEPHRRELRVHCYRMLGSFHDAEDMVQETLLRAWRGLQGFDGRASTRYWLYRIATNACLNALAARASAGRVLPETQSPATERMPDREPASDIAWLEPYPDSALDRIADDAPGPAARYEMREAVQLAFIAAIQLLPPRQRAALLLSDVLGWSAAESARLLDSSVAAVNSALQRARATLEERLPGGPPRTAVAASDAQRALLERYVRAWESTDVDGLTALLKEDASDEHAAVEAVVPRTRGDCGVLRWYGEIRRARAVPACADRRESAADVCLLQPLAGSRVAISLDPVADAPRCHDRGDDQLRHAGVGIRVRSARSPA